MATPTTIRPTFAQIAGLAVFVITALILGGVMGSALNAALDTVAKAADIFSTLSGAIAMLEMFIGIGDIWLRGGKLRPVSAKLLRALAIVGILAAMATSLLGRNTSLPIILLPATAVYFFAERRQPGLVRSRWGKAASSRPAAEPQPVKSRQKRGGKKRR